MVLTISIRCRWISTRSVSEFQLKGVRTMAGSTPEDLGRELQETRDKVSAAAGRVSSLIGEKNETIGVQAEVIDTQSQTINTQSVEIARLLSLIEGQPDLQAQLTAALGALNQANANLTAANNSIGEASNGLDIVQDQIDAIAADPSDPKLPTETPSSN